MKRGERVVAVHMNGDGRVLRGRVGSKRGANKSAYSVEEFSDGMWLNFLDLRMEGIIWARGWNTKAAAALKVAVALETT